MLTSGSQFAHYQIAGSLGAGGMGEVYRATDTKLKRDVALKVLPPDFATDAERLARFQREAEMLAALNHPNIGQIYGIENSGGITALIMELIEGPTLAERIEKGAVPPDEALNIALQICTALEAAHERGIVHRDLKPANIKLKTDGTVKVLDFGIAKAVESTHTSGRHTPTMVTPAVTESGTIMGTAAYMSPEQARGKFVDQRTDIWAFGCVLFEMLTGQPAFGGEDVMTTLARVLDRDTDLQSMPKTLSPAVRHTIQMCLKKDPRKRIADIRDVRLALAGEFDAQPHNASANALQMSAAKFLQRALPLALGLAVVTGAAAWWFAQPPLVQQPVTRFGHNPAPGQSLRNTGRNILALSPDGRRFVYNTNEGLMLRELDQEQARLIPGTEPALVNPVFSPDGQYLAYWNTGNADLVRVAISGGAPVTIAAGAGLPWGASWEEDGTILFGKGAGIFRVPANGGVPELIVPRSEGDPSYGAPELLPDGEHVLFSRGDTNVSMETVAQSLVTGERKVVVPAGHDAHYLDTGHLTYVYQNTLFVIAFDVDTLTTSGTPVPLVQEVSMSSGSHSTNYDVARDGTLVFHRGADSNDNETLVWVDREGREEELGMPTRAYALPRVSPDGGRFTIVIDGDVWVGDIARKVLNRITSTNEAEFYPDWTPDGERLVYSIDNRTLAWTAADGTGAVEELVTFNNTSLLATGVWTAEGELLLTMNAPEEWVGSRLGKVAPFAQQERPLPWEFVIDREHGASNSALSPDGKWLLYNANDTGAWGVYLERYPELGGRQLVSDASGGYGPLWSPDGTELFYRRLGDGAMMRVPVETAPSLRIGTAELLFESDAYIPLATPQAGEGTPRYWDIAPDGRFLMLKSGALNFNNGLAEFVIAENWTEELKRLVPVE